MDDIHTAKSVLKKLSALRATLLDEEQLYLDLLVVGRRTTTVDTGPDTAKVNVSGATGNLDEDSSEIAEFIDGADTGKIAWNSILEVYELENT